MVDLLLKYTLVKFVGQYHRVLIEINFIGFTFVMIVHYNLSTLTEPRVSQFQYE